MSATSMVPPEIANAVRFFTAGTRSGDTRKAVGDSIQRLTGLIEGHAALKQKLLDLKRLEQSIADQIPVLMERVDPEDEEAVSQITRLRTQRELLPNRIDRVGRDIPASDMAMSAVVDEIKPQLEGLHESIMSLVIAAPVAALEPFVADKKQRELVAAQTDAVAQEIKRQAGVMLSLHGDGYSRANQLRSALASAGDVLASVKKNR